uniref:Myelin expression factor 2 n=1 Tax=Callorhinchus milii TaxID=7868 RepID=A0A4W3JV97_CALMI
MYFSLMYSEEDESSKEETSSLKEKSIGIKKSNRFHPYSKEKTANGDKKGYNRNRVFISNIPYDMKWQAIKDLMREKVGEVTYVELFKDAEGKSRVSGTILVVEFKTEDFVNKAMDIMNKFDLSGRPLTIKEDPDGEHARRAMQRGSYPGVLGLDMGSPIVNLPPNIVNNPNIPSEVITALQGGRLGTTVFVANLDFKVGWKKLKEVFCMAGVVKRADIKEDKDGKSRGIGTVTFDQSIEAVQAISMFNGQLLFDRPMHVKMDDKSVPHDDYRVLESKSQQLPRGLAGIGMGLGPGGQPIAANQMNSGMGNMGSGGGGMAGMNSMGGVMGMGMDRMGSNLDRMGSGMGVGLDRNMDMDRGFGNLNTGSMGSGLRERGSGFRGCQIFARNLPYDLPWQKLKEKFSQCGHVMFAEIKMENGMSKGCGTVLFDTPEAAEKACRLMNGTKITGREIDVRLDRNA